MDGTNGAAEIVSSRHGITFVKTESEEELIEKLQKQSLDYEKEKESVIAECNLINLKLSKKYDDDLNLTEDENRLFAKRQEYFERQFALGMVNVRKKLLAVKKQADDLEMRVDEIDNGVSGSVAHAIGKKMHTLAQSTQVFAVTHLSPVAVWANTHYLVEKKDQDNKTTTYIKALNEKERIHELAMISQGNCDATSIEAAKTLYDSVHKQ